MQSKREAKAVKDAFAGSWRITDMELWDEDARDLVGPAYIKFGRDGTGEFRFIAVEGEMDCRFTERDGKPRVTFSWQGWDETDEATGRGWGVITKNGRLKGRIYFHQGDDSSFTARRKRNEMGPAQLRRDDPRSR